VGVVSVEAELEGIHEATGQPFAMLDPEVYAQTTGKYLFFF
jgi:hypothetical protein